MVVCAIFRDTQAGDEKAEPRLLSHLPQEAVNTSWPSLGASSWVWRLLEPRGGPPAPQLLPLSIAVKHTHKYINSHTHTHKKHINARKFTCAPEHQSLSSSSECRHLVTQALRPLMFFTHSKHKVFICVTGQLIQDDVIGRWCHFYKVFGVERILTALWRTN